MPAKIKRKNRQPERFGRTAAAAYVPWVPRRGRWRTGKTTGEITWERQMMARFEREGGATQTGISGRRHFTRAAERLGDAEGDGKWRYHDNVHSLITLSGAENEVDTHKLFRRLIGVKQTEAILAGYYIAASHNRHSHSLGTMHLTGRIGKRLGLPAKTIAELRVAALVHDIGHVAFSHGADQILKRKLGVSHEELGIQRMRDAGLHTLIEKHGLDFEQVAKYMRGEGLGQIITEYADRMDYLQRDGLNTAVRPQLQKQVKLTVEEIIRNLKLHKGNLCVAAEGEDALKKFADIRTLFYSQIYFHPLSMLTRHFLRRALETGSRKGIITVKDLLERSDDIILSELARNKVPEAEQLYLHSVDYNLTSVFSAHFGQLKPNALEKVKTGEVARKIERALKRKGFKPHEFYVGVTPNVAKPITYEVLQKDGTLNRKTYAPQLQPDEQLLFVYAINTKEKIARQVIQRHVQSLTHEPHVEPDLYSNIKV
ncbi:MAG: HD domain-containing protein [Candidatus Micrarchaeota archaeon]